MEKKFTLIVFRLLLSITVLALLAPNGLKIAQASAPIGTIAYVTSNQATGDEIHLIEPDQSNDRRIFSTGVPTSGGMDIQQLAWKPNASEIAFTSFHEGACSMYQSDIFAISPDGSNYRRVSSPPACGSAAGLPTGTVTVPVFNNTTQGGEFLIYFQGAPGAVKISLGSGESSSVTFNNVVDFGNKVQYAVWISGEVRGLYPGASGDVQPGASLETGQLKISTGFEHYGFQWPTYTPDGSKIASIFDKDWLFMVAAANQEMGQTGERKTFDLTLSSNFLTWGPTTARASQFLFGGWSSTGIIYLGDVNNTQGQELVNVDPTYIGKQLLGLSWLPDGSGFLYSVSEMQNYVDKANVWEYSFATQQSKRVTNVSSGFIRRLSVSPDGQHIVYEYQPYGYWYEEFPVTDLWTMNRDGSGQALLVQGARSPVWSPAAIPAMNPAPALTSIDPSVVDAGGAAFTLTVKGSNFVNGSLVRWDGTDLPTTFVSATSLTAQVTADKITATGPVSVTTFTPAPGGGASNALTLSIVNPQPVLTSLSPTSAIAGGAAFILTVSGSKFIPGSVIRWNATDLVTTYVNATTLTAQITADKISTAGTAAVTVSNGSPGGGESAPKTFTINANNGGDQTTFLPLVVH